ncbi:MAG: serine protease [Parachlamydia sp.]|nr:serine protease [Parachlamydia sp.]
MTLRGHLGKTDVQRAEILLEKLKAHQLIIEINSTSGDLGLVLELAKRIYELKVKQGLQTIVYIEDNAVGPSAIIPFLADELYISLSVSWGDIPLGTAQALSTNILRNRVTSFISPAHPQASLLNLLASGMSDPSVQIVDDKGWKIATEGTDRSLPRLSSPGEPLVVNQNQLQQLKLVSGAMPLDQFETQYALKLKTEAKEVPEAKEVIIREIPSNTREQEIKAHIKYSDTGPNRVGLITINERDSSISDATWIYVKKAVDFYKETKPIFVILELNTPGGEVFAAEKISDALKELDTQYNIPVVAFIDNWAISAGALLAYSCRFIAIVKDAAMGAAEPLTVEGGESKVASEKVNSAFRADFSNRAAFYGRNSDLAQAMVDKDVILVYRFGQIVRLDSESQIRSKGPDPDVVINSKGKLLTLNSEQLMKYGVADLQVLPQKLVAVTPEEKEKGQWPASKMLLFSAPVFNAIPNAIIQPYKMDWKTRFFVLLANPIVQSALFLGLMLGLYMEISSPGVSLPGSIAALCLFMIILSSFALEVANWLEVILLLSGLAILLVELFVLPTFGFLGFVGIIFFLAGLFGMMLPGIGSVQYEVDTNTLNAAGEALFKRLVWLCGTLVLGFGLILLLARYITPSLAGFNRFVLAGSEQEGFIAGESPQMLPQPGSEGEASTTLRPAGKVIIQDVLYDAITPGGFIEKGSKIFVERLDGSVIVVNTKEEA